jgi:hypothetical protein
VAVNLRIAWSDFQVVGVRGFLGHLANMARITSVVRPFF